MKDTLDSGMALARFRSYGEFRDAMQPCLEVNWDPTKTLLTHVRVKVPADLARRRNNNSNANGNSNANSTNNNTTQQQAQLHEQRQAQQQQQQQLQHQQRMQHTQQQHLQQEIGVHRNTVVLPTPPRGGPHDQDREHLRSHAHTPQTAEENHHRDPDYTPEFATTTTTGSSTASPNIENLPPAVRHKLEATLLGFYVRLMNSSAKAAQLKRQAADVSHLLEQIGDDDDAPDSDMELKAQLHRELLIKREKYFTLVTKGEDLDTIRGRLSGGGPGVGGGGSRRGSFQTAGEIPTTDPRRTSNFLRRSSVTPMRNQVNWSKVQSRTNTGRRDSGSGVGAGSRINEYRRQTIHDPEVQRRPSMNQAETQSTAAAPDQNAKLLQPVSRATVQERRNSVAGQVGTGAGPVTRSKVRIGRGGNENHADRFKSAALRSRDGAETDQEPSCAPTSTQAPQSVAPRQRNFRPSFSTTSRSLNRPQ